MQSLGEGISTGAELLSLQAILSGVFAETPPPKIKPLAWYFATASAALYEITSTTDSWNAAAISDTF